MLVRPRVAEGHGTPPDDYRPRCCDEVFSAAHKDLPMDVTAGSPHAHPHRSPGRPFTGAASFAGGARSAVRVVVATVILSCMVSDGTPTRGDETAASKPAAALRALDIEGLADRIRPSVVVITIEGRDGRPLGVGSGFVVSPDGLIATNLHVIGEARPIRVRLADGRKFDVTEVHATDRAMDLAVVRIAARDLPALSLADTRSVRPGRPVVAIGNPLGLELSVVAGVVSGRRDIDGKPMFQLAIPIEQGNSGGPAVDADGKVIGILTLKSALSDNLGFAVDAAALRPLLEKPNPIPIEKWLTIGALDPRRWRTYFGASWRRRAGRIHVQGRGEGLGRRSLCIWQGGVPDGEFDVQVLARLHDDDGAAGLVFHFDGEMRHYGFYPSGGQLRLSRFDGPDVFSWRVLREVPGKAYRPGDWNALRVHIRGAHVECYCNGHRVITFDVQSYSRGQVGLCQFRETEAEFRSFRVGRNLPPLVPTEAEITAIAGLLQDWNHAAGIDPELLARHPQPNDRVRLALIEYARRLERKAERIRKLAGAAHVRSVAEQIARIFDPENESAPDLIRAALLVAALDNPELDVAAYVRQFEAMAEELRNRTAGTKNAAEKLAMLDRYFFEDLGFHGGRTNYYSPANSYLNDVMDDREGLPITLGILYAELGRRIGLALDGVGLPGHFVVRYTPDKGPPVWIDVFDRGKRLTRDQAAAKSRSITGEEPDEHAFAPLPPDRIVERMLRNLIGIAQRREDEAALLRYVEALVALHPDSVPERTFRAYLRYRGEQYDGAIRDIQWLRRHAADQVDLGQLDRLRQAIEAARSD
ncbi:MAG: hypothetical protein D6725_04975 [Planctomycetota bacterium]|nr:MAG: hypothetical protein D6725_04975 [Planctomycetota bacterium]